MVTNTGTLANGLRKAFYVEFGLYGLWILLSLKGGDSLLSALCGPFLVWAGIRIVACGKNFLQTELDKSPRTPDEQLNLIQSLRLFWGELWITCLTYSFFFPFEKQFTPTAPKAGLAHQGHPIVLVPGFACNRGYWVLMRKWLAKAGYGKVYAVTLEPVFGSIEANAKNLATQIESICQHSGSDKVILIGHSMAGLTTRVYLHQLNGAERIAKIISLGAPHNGTSIAKGLQKLGKNLEQMQPSSEWSSDFNQATTGEPCPVPFVNVVTPHDNIVAPQHSCRLSKTYAKQVVLPGIGHLEMVASKPVLNVILEEL
jgi:hypothetical protein